jgi:putative nucleotidyltransferase with HDIG domain
MTHSTDRIPSVEECLDLIARHGMLENIKEHSILVMKVARAIASSLKPECAVNINLVAAGAVLHDITKTRALVSHEPHAKTGADLLASIGMFSVAEIVRAHVEITDFNPDGPLLEKEIVHYADKRVKHSTIVTLKERVDDLLVRYGTTEEHKARIMEKIPFNESLEKKIRSSIIGDLEKIIRKVR